MTHKELENGEKPDEAFLLFPQNPTLGQTWNPDGVSITIVGIGDKIHIGEKEHTVYQMAFGLDDTTTVLIWFRPGMGILRQVDNIDGKINIYERSAEIVLQ